MEFELRIIRPRESYNSTNQKMREHIFNIIYSIIVNSIETIQKSVAKESTPKTRTKRINTLNIHNFNNLTLPPNASAIPRQTLPSSYTTESGNRVNKDPSQIKENDLLCYINDPRRKLARKNTGNNYFITTYDNYQRIKSLDGGNMVKLIGIAQPLHINPTQNIHPRSNMRPFSKNLYVDISGRRKILSSTTKKDDKGRNKGVPIKDVSNSLPISVRERIVHGIVRSKAPLHNEVMFEGKPNRIKGKPDIRVTFKLSTYLNTTKKFGKLGKSPLFQREHNGSITPEQIELLKDVMFVYTTEVNGVEYYLIQNYQSDRFILWMNYNGYLVETPCIFVPPNELSNRPLENLFPAASASASAPSNRRNRGNGGSAGAGGTM
jgi:hypothetical protein